MALLDYCLFINKFIANTFILVGVLSSRLDNILVNYLLCYLCLRVFIIDSLFMGDIKMLQSQRREKELTQQGLFGEMQGAKLQNFRKLKSVVLQFYSSSEHRAVLWSQVTFFPLYALTNKVYRSTFKDHTILVKIYQASLPEFADKDLQVRIIRQLSKQHMYPQLLFACSFFRVQRFVHSVEINRFSLGEEKILQIVRQMAEYSCGFRQLVSDYNRENGRQQVGFRHLPRLFRQMYKDKMRECPHMVQQCEANFSLIFDDAAVMERLGSILQATELVLSHNDCHTGNILVTAERIYILDFEFSQFNFIGFDLGNFFNEWTIEYGEVFEMRAEWEMEEGLKQRAMEVYFGTLMGGYSFRGREYWQWYTQVGRVLSHMFWMIIGLKQIDDMRIKFDMVEYVRRRQVEFSKHFQILMYTSV